MSKSEPFQTRDRPLVIWQVLDERPGHRNQVLGLCNAVQRLVPAEIHTIEVTTELRGFRGWLPGRCRSFQELPRPDILVAAGHSTHLPLLRLRQRFGGRTVVMMKPSLPLRIFDLCLIPDTHEFAQLPANVVQTQGALNRIQPSPRLAAGRGLILIGGPSSHYKWSDQEVLEQVEQIVHREQNINWTVATSRRTPERFVNGFRQAKLTAALVEAAMTTSDWLPQHLAESATVWVTSDSVSMLYEALTAGGAVGMLSLQPQKLTRVVKAGQSLIAAGHIGSFSDWTANRPLPRATHALCEAERCARIVVDRLVVQQSGARRAA